MYKHVFPTKQLPSNVLLLLMSVVFPSPVTLSATHKCH